MLGALCGDIVGSPYEFDRGEKRKDFGPLFIWDSTYTDDSVMSIAIAQALLNVGKDADVETMKKEIVRCMQWWGKREPYAGYGSSFSRWLREQVPMPYGSYGNGSAMRVSPAGWLYDSLERTREVARATAEVTHNHPEGIKGAEATASAIYLARTGKSKDEIRDYIRKEFGYPLVATLDEIRPAYFHVESCQETVPQAIEAFLEGNGFEDVIRNAVSLGGDCDTLTCIAGSIAEAMYTIPEEIKEEVLDHINEEMLSVYLSFDNVRTNGWVNNTGRSGSHVN